MRKNGSIYLRRGHFISTGRTQLAWLSIVLSGLDLQGCSSADRELGRVSTAGPSPFGAPVLIAELAAADATQQSPTLTEDELELYYATTLNGGLLQIWTSTRASRSDIWTNPHAVVELASASNDITPEVSADGLVLWFASDRSGPSTKWQLWQTQRASRDVPWSSPSAVTNPTPGTRDMSPSFDASGLWLAYASASAGDNFDIYLAARAASAEPWGQPSALTNLNSDTADWDPALFAEGTKLMFASRRNGPGKLFEASRSTVAEPFSDPTLVDELNTSSEEGGPWVSADGKRIYFFSGRSGVPRLYFAQR